MPRIKQYEVEQTRKVRVSATSELAAHQLAEEAFRTNGQAENTSGRTQGEIEILDVRITQEI